MTSIPEAARQIRQEESERTRLYQRFSSIVGAFDASEMTAAEIAAYGLKKLGMKLPSDDCAKVYVANSYLAGREKALAIAACGRSAMDSGDSFIDRYLGEA